MKLTTFEGVTIDDIVAETGWSREFISKIGSREGWEKQSVGVIYAPSALESIREYALSQKRTDLLKKAGWMIRANIARIERSNQYDIACPKCQGFAVSFDNKIVCENDCVP